MDATFKELIDDLIAAAGAEARGVIPGSRLDYARIKLESAIARLATPAPKPPPEGILHSAFAAQLHRDAEEALQAIEEQQAKREQRLAAEQKREDDRRAIVTVGGDVGADTILFSTAPNIAWKPFKSAPRSGDMDQVATAMQPQRKEFLG